MLSHCIDFYVKNIYYLVLIWAQTVRNIPICAGFDGAAQRITLSASSLIFVRIRGNELILPSRYVLSMLMVMLASERASAMEFHDREKKKLEKRRESNSMRRKCVLTS